MTPGDYDERMPQMRQVTQELVLDGAYEGVQMKLDDIRGLKTAYLSATASVTADTVYTVPTGKIVVSKNVTITNAALAPALFDIFDSTTQLDAIYVGAQDSVVFERNYRFATSIIVYCSAWLTQTAYSFSYWEFPLTNRATTPP
jgi:hypothetical protein